MPLGKTFEEILKICSDINTDTILKACEYIDNNGVPPRRTSINRYIEFDNGKKYPTKYVIEVANNIILGHAGDKELKSQHFASWDAEHVLYELIPEPMPFKIINKDFKEIRQNIINKYKDLGYVIEELGDYTAIKKTQGQHRNNTLVEIEKIKRSRPFSIRIAFNKLDNYLQEKCEKVPETYHWSNDAIFKIDETAETEKIAYEIIDNIIKKTDETESEEIKGTDITGLQSNCTNHKIALNQILYGPPGTGKTYNTIVKAIQILDVELYKKYDAYLEELKKDKNFKILEDSENYADYKMLLKRYNDLKEEGRIEFITFHQSYSYEEFVEGIKPDIDWEDDDEDTPQESKKDIKYIGKDGIFKKMCYITLKDKFNEFIKRYNNDSLPIFKNSNGDTEFKVTKCDGITFAIERTNTPEKSTNSIDFQKFKNAIFIDVDNEEQLKASEKYKAMQIGNGIEAQVLSVRNYIRNELLRDKKVLVIDEINRGNISKIFGELITLIEEDKRENVTGEDKEYNTIQVTLPYSGDTFTVPNNLYIIGTMNTSDRSIASVDIALRRRFKFVEMMPEESCVDNNEKIIGGKTIRDIFNLLNQRICALLDRDHQIGHSYFIGVNTVDKLKDVWFDSVMPLLNEYFYGDWEKLQAILGKVGEAKDNGYSFIQRFETGDLFVDNNICDESFYCDLRDKSIYKENKIFIDALLYAFYNIVPDGEKNRNDQK